MPCRVSGGDIAGGRGEVHRWFVSAGDSVSATTSGILPAMQTGERYSPVYGPGSRR
jgi:hypothetical protein